MDGGNLVQPHPSQSLKEAKQAMKFGWRKQNKDYIPEDDSIKKLCRNQHTKISRLRTAHCGLESHTFTQWVSETLLVEYQSNSRAHPTRLTKICHTENGNLNHRATLWEKLWGTGEDLRHTFLIMTHEGIMNHGPWRKIRNYIANADLNKENEIEARLALSNHPVFLKKLMIINIFVSYKQQCNCLNTNRMFNTLMSS